MGPAIENQLAKLGEQLNRVARELQQTTTDVVLAEQSVQRKAFLDKVTSEADDLNAAILERKFVIERRKEGLERLQLKKLDEEKRRKEAEEDHRRKEEEERLRREEALRKEAKIQKIKEMMDVEKTRKAIASLGISIDDRMLEEMDEASRRKLLIDAQTEANKLKEEEAKRLSDQSKRLDHITRALRIEAAPLVEKKYAEQVESDRAVYDAKIAASLAAQKEEHNKALQEKARLARMQAYRAGFEEGLLVTQRAVYERKVSEMLEMAWHEHRLRKIAKARRKKIEYDERMEEDAELERERLAREEEERYFAEEQERLRREKEAEEEAEKLRLESLEKARKERLESVRASKALESSPMPASEPDPDADEWRSRLSKRAGAPQFVEDRGGRVEEPVRSFARAAGARGADVAPDRRGGLAPAGVDRWERRGGGTESEALAGSSWRESKPAEPEAGWRYDLSYLAYAYCSCFISMYLYVAEHLVQVLYPRGVSLTATETEKGEELLIKLIVGHVEVMLIEEETNLRLGSLRAARLRMILIGDGNNFPSNYVSIFSRHCLSLMTFVIVRLTCILLTTKRTLIAVDHYKCNTSTVFTVLKLEAMKYEQ